MKRLLSLVLVVTVLLGQAPAWALVGRERCMPQASLACLRVCTKSASLLSRGGQLPTLGQNCAKVETRLAQPSLAALRAPALVLPMQARALSAATARSAEPSLAFIHRAHAPPRVALAQIYQSVPVAQAPPALI